METNRQNSAVSERRSWPVILLKLSSIVLLVILANIGISSLIDKLGFQFYPVSLRLVEQAIFVGLVLYICLMAMPFLPGIEIGLVLMILLGPQGVVLIYICTLIALTLSFGLGRIVPADLLASLLRWLHFVRAEKLLKTFNETPPDKRLAFLAEKAPTKTISGILKRRYLVLAALLNLPGNALIGGAGGIAMMAGMSRLYTFPRFLFLISIAILPGPILVTVSNFFS